MRHSALAVVLLLSSSLPSPPQQKEVVVHNGFGAGQEYLDMTDSQRRAYAVGFINGILLSPALGAPKNRVGWVERCVEGMSDVQVAAILHQYIKSHPAEWHWGLHILSYRALIEACPDSPSKPGKD